MLTHKEAAEKRRIDAKAFLGKATRKELLRGLELKRKRDRPTGRAVSNANAK